MATKTEDSVGMGIRIPKTLKKNIKKFLEIEKKTAGRFAKPNFNTFFNVAAEEYLKHVAQAPQKSAA